MTTVISNSWVKYFKPKRQPHLRLFCFPYSGGGASVFRSWSDDLPPGVEICPIQLPGRENRLTETPFQQISPLVETLAQVLGPYLDVPFALFGHSMGALISFELARQFRREGIEPVHLFVSGRRAPQLPAGEPPVNQLPELAFLQELRRLNGTPEEILQNSELMQLILPTLRADFTLCETHTYLHEAPLNCPISAFGGSQDGRVSHSELAAWQDQTNNSFALQMLPGNHFFVQSAYKSLLASITQILNPLLDDQRS